jgi:dGTPase
MEETARSRQWASTMQGAPTEGVRLARRGDDARLVIVPPMSRHEREQAEDQWLAGGATRSSGAGRRAHPEEADPMRTCFERDRDRILHAAAFRRLAGKTQVFVFPDDHQRTRLTHALEVAQVATAVARAARLNVALTEAIALAHDCGHGPGGHASEDAFSPFIDGGYDHAVWGADVVLEDLNLCAETLDGVRNHSWSRPSPATPEGLVVSWADRIAYCCHDLEDATLAGIVSAQLLPDEVRVQCGVTRSEQLRAFIAALVETIASTGRIGMSESSAGALAALRAFNYEHIYLRPASVAQSQSVIAVLRALVEHFADRPNAVGHARGGAAGGLGLEAGGGPAAGGRLEAGGGLEAGSEPAVRKAVTWVAGMTDRYAFRTAVAALGWDPAKLPTGVDSPGLR